MTHLPLGPLLAYVGPDTMLPLASVLAAALGGLLFCWGWIVRTVKAAFSALVPGRKKPDADAPAGSEPESPGSPAGR